MASALTETMLADVEPERIEPGPGQESVWDYPRPPRHEPTPHRLVVEFAGVTIADTTRGIRVLETSQAPAYYIPPDDVRLEHIAMSTRRTFCEWKGSAEHFDVQVGDEIAPESAWRYSTPTRAFQAIAGHFAFYPGRVDACYVDGELVTPMEGNVYGGWITSKIVGPVKGGPGTAHW